MDDETLEVSGTRSMAGLVREHLKWIQAKKKQGYSMKDIADTLSKKYDRLIQPNTLCKIVARATEVGRGGKAQTVRRSPQERDNQGPGASRPGPEKDGNLSAVGRITSSSDFIERMSRKMD